MTDRARVAVLLSGRGSNFLALHGAMERGEVPAEIALVVSNVAEAAGLERARALRLPTVCLPHRLDASRQAHEAKVLAALAHAGVEWVCLAGYMRLLSAGVRGRLPATDPQHPPQPAAGLPGARRAASRRWSGASGSPAARSTWSTRSSTTGRSSSSGRCRCGARTPRSRWRRGSWSRSTRPTPRRCAVCSRSAGGWRAAGSSFPGRA